MFGIHWGLSNVFFSCCTFTNLWVWAVSVSGQCEKSKLVFTVRCKWSILTLSIQVLGWIEGFLDTRLLIWHHYEDVIQLTHLHYIGLTMSVALLRERGKYYRKRKLFKSFRDVSEMSIVDCHKTLNPSKIYWGKWTYKLLVEKIGIHLTDTRVVLILLFPRAVTKQFINWLMNKIFWNTVGNLSFFSACKPRVDKVFKTFDNNFMGLTSIIFVGQSQDAPIIFQKENKEIKKENKNTNKEKGEKHRNPCCSVQISFEPDLHT